MGDNFWGDMDGDGDADRWDDFFGDGLLMETMRAEEKHRRGEPLTREEAEWLGVDYRRHAVPRAHGGYPAPAPVQYETWQVVLVSLLFVAFFFICMLSL